MTFIVIALQVATTKTSRYFWGVKKYFCHTKKESCILLVIFANKFQKLCFERIVVDLHPPAIELCNLRDLPQYLIANVRLCMPNILLLLFIPAKAPGFRVLKAGQKTCSLFRSIK